MWRSIAVRAVVVVVLLAPAMPLAGQTIPPPGADSVNKLIAVLKSDASQHEKVEACRQLGVVGTKEAVPVLAGLLGDEKLAHMARYALEPIPDPAVDEALRAALGRLKGRLLVGVIGSLGVRRDAKAIEPLAGLLTDPDADVAQAAARALGSIGTTASAKAIQGALPATPAGNRLAFCEGLFRVAESLVAKGQRDEAVAIYDGLRALEPAPHQVRAGALRGAILARGDEGLMLLKQGLASGDYILFAAAVRTAQEMTVQGVTEALTASLDQLPADRQIVVIQTLAQRADRAAVPAIRAAAKSGPKPVRLAAIRAVPALPGAGTVLLELVEDPDAEIAKAAQESLAGVAGAEVDAAVIEMLASGQARERLAALELIGQRRMTQAVPQVVKALGDADAQVRQSALRRLGELSGPDQLPALLDLLMAAKTPQDLNAAEQAVSSVAAKADTPQATTEKLVARMAGAPVAQKSALLRVLGSLGGAGALEAVRGAVKDPNAEVRAAAIRVLSAWKTAEALPDLLALAQASGDPAGKRLALRGYLAWAGRAGVPADQRLEICREAAKIVQSPEEKRLLLAALGNVASADSVSLIVPFLDDEATREEAGTAVVSVAERLLKGKNAGRVAPKLIEPLEKVAKTASGEELKQRANAAIGLAKRKVRTK
jgi:HEAT repeat protein